MCGGQGCTLHVHVRAHLRGLREHPRRLHFIFSPALVTHTPSTRIHLRAQSPQMLDYRAVSSRRRLAQTSSVDAVLKVCSGVGGRLEGGLSICLAPGVVSVDSTVLRGVVVIEISAGRGIYVAALVGWPGNNPLPWKSAQQDPRQ